MHLQKILADVSERVIGRDREVRLIVAALEAGRDLVLEGPPGTSKSTLLRAITQVEGKRLFFVEGNADLTPSKLVGHHSPSQVLSGGYGPESFLPGPLPSAMTEGGFLYIEELNRVPEDTLNVLITAMAERELTIPRFGVVRAQPGFRVIAAMNPFDNIGTGRLSGALTDRLCRVRLAYQSEKDERKIVASRAPHVDSLLVDVAVRASRLTRQHPEVRMGASVRAAVDFALIADRIAALRPLEPMVGALLNGSRDALVSLVEAGQTALGVKIAIKDGVKKTDDEILESIIKRALAEILAERGDVDPGGTDPPTGGAPDGDPSESGSSCCGAPRTEPADAEHPPEGVASGSGRRHHPMTYGYHGGMTPIGEGGELLDREDERARARQRGNHKRRFDAVAAEHPDLAAALDDPELDMEGLTKALEGEEDPLSLLGDLAGVGDRPHLRALARRLGTEIIVHAARSAPGEGSRGGRGRLSSVRYRGEGGELDLDRTLERALEKPQLSDDDLHVLERREHRRSYALMLDVSGSMKGAKFFYAALALAAMAARAGTEPIAVVAFWRNAVTLKHLREPLELAPLVDLVLSLSGRGLTDVHLGLKTGFDELSKANTQERIGILFSDCIQTAGQHADEIAAAFPTLHVVGTSTIDESRRRCAELAVLGHGRCAFVEDVDGIAPALSACLAN